MGFDCDNLSAVDKAEALFRYLEEFSKIRLKVTRNIKEYGSDSISDCIDLQNLPLDNEWIEARFHDSSFNEGPILRVAKPDLQSCPNPPREVVRWLANGWESYKSEIGFVFPSGEDTLSYEASPQDVFFSEPQRASLFREWNNLREKWVGRQKKAMEASRLYEQLFKMREKLKNDPDKLELVAASMNVRLLEDPKVDHPIFAKKLAICLDASGGCISVEDVDSDTLIQKDLLSQSQALTLSGIQEEDERLVESGVHPLDRDAIGREAKMLVNKLSPKARYFDSWDAPSDGISDIDVRPGFYLLFRQRPDGTPAAIDRIVNTIEKTRRVPSFLNGLLGVFAPVETGMSSGELVEETTVDRRLAEANGEDDDILLAKPANRAQLEIARRIEQEDAVLVQGPPGTGKTHTIANLMGSFLAQGKRVLVTSYTSKALTVLSDKMPAELRGLCVSTLEANGEDARDSIEAIVSHLGEHSTAELKKTIDELSRQREEILVELAEARRGAFKEREVESRKFEVEDELLTPYEAAQYVAQNKDELEGIIPGDVKLSAHLDMPMIAELYGSNNVVTAEDEDEASRLDDVDWMALVPKQDMYAGSLKELSGAGSMIADILDRHGWQLRADLMAMEIEGISVPILDDESEAFQLLHHYKDQGKLTSEWERGVAARALRGTDEIAIWLGLCDEVISLEESASAYRRKWFSKRIDLGDCDDFCKLANTVEEYKEYLGKTGLRKLLSSVKNMPENITINGKRMFTAEDCDSILDYIKLEEQRCSCAAQWDALMGSVGVDYFAELAENEPEHEAARYIDGIKRALSWQSECIDPVFKLLDSNGLPYTVFFDCFAMIDEVTRVADYSRVLETDIADYLQLCAAIKRSQRVKSWAEGVVKGIESAGCVHGETVEALTESYASLCSADTLGGVNNLTDKVQDYLIHYDRLCRLCEIRSAVQHRGGLLDRMAKDAPEWSRSIRMRRGIHGGVEVPRNIAQAWKYKQCQAILGYVNQMNASDPQQMIAELGKRYRMTTARLAGEMAWLKIHMDLERDTELKIALNGWKQTVAKIGKGTGKNASRYRSKARELMAKCQRAVPAWIMPINQALDSFDPCSNVFDIVIIDEASQADMTALAITYLAKKIIVVGDDKQVSPLAVGAKDATADGLAASYIEGKGIPNSHLYRAKYSLYEIAQQGFAPIMLTEHFRCVPDIIGFSNLLSYDGKIKALRDADAGGLTPALVPFRVKSGMRSGKAKINKQEARAVVAIIRACLEQPEYEKKTFGVLSLLGEEQADFIRNELLKEIEPADIDKHEIICGNAAGFQGDERDVMILSMVDSNESETPLRLMGAGPDDAYKKRYNVAVSRAKDQLWLVYSLDPARDLKEGDLRRRLIEYMLNPHALDKRIEEARGKAESDFELQVCAELAKRGYQFEQQKEVGSYRIDIIVKDAHRSVALECDGDRWHSTESQIISDMERQTILERVGWNFIRIRGSQFYSDRDATMAQVEAELNHYGIERGYRPDVEVQESSDLLDRVFEEVHDLFDDEVNEATLKSTKARESAIEFVLQSGFSNGHNAAAEECGDEEKMREHTDKHESRTEEANSGCLRLALERSGYKCVPSKQADAFWVLGDLSIQSSIKEIASSFDYGFDYRADGADVTKGNPGWLLYSKGSHVDISDERRHAEVKESSQGVQGDPLLDALKSLGVTFIDKRDKQGALWVIDCTAFRNKKKALERQHGVRFVYSERGSRSTHFQSAWYTKGTTSK